MRYVGGIIAGIIVLVVVIGLFAFHGYSTPSDMVAIRVGAGPFEAKKIKGDCVPPSTRGYLTNDSYHYFPTSEREWDATGQKGSDAKPFESVTNDKVIMKVPITIRFTLRTDCPTLKDFYAKYARRYGVEFKNGDGTFDETGASYNQAWLDVLRKLVADPSDQTLDRIVQGYDWQKVWNDPATKTEIEQKMTDALRGETSLLVQTAHKSYFDGITVLVGKPIPPKALASAVAETQTRVAKAQAAEAQAKADVAKANAEVDVSIAEAKKRRAEIAGYGSVEAYNINECINTSGCNPYPSPIIPGYTVPAPSGGK
jgi:SPFH domain / Band 7 family